MEFCRSYHICGLIIKEYPTNGDFLNSTKITIFEINLANTARPRSLFSHYSENRKNVKRRYTTPNDNEMHMLKTEYAFTSNQPTVILVNGRESARLDADKLGGNFKLVTVMRHPSAKTKSARNYNSRKLRAGCVPTATFVHVH